MKSPHSFSQNRGQSLIEVAIAFAIGGILIGSATIAIVAIFRSETSSQRLRASSQFNYTLLFEVRSLVSADWNAFSVLPRGSGSHFHVTTTGALISIVPGDAVVVDDTVSYSVYFYVDDVSRDSAGNVVASGGTNDPLTMRITAVTEWLAGGDLRSSEVRDYVTRWRNTVFQQSDWSGAQEEGPLTDPGDGFSSSMGLMMSTGAIRIEGL